MPRSKQFVKSKEKPVGRGKKPPKAPETPNEYLEAADEFETAGSKWKAGDAAKALRFYVRASDVYNEALNRFPKDFDLAYNKAHLLYLVLSEPTLKDLAVAQNDDEIMLLSQALDAHRYALNLDQTNADILFNTAQVLTMYAEELDEDSAETSIKNLQEAVELFDACATRQEMEYEEQVAARSEMSAPATNGKDQSETAAPESNAREPSDEEWVLVTQPITPGSLLDTALATLSALTSLVRAYTEEPPASFHASTALAAVTSLAAKILDTKVPVYISLLESAPRGEVAEEQGPVLSLTGSSSMTSQRPADPVQTAKEESILAAAQFRAALANAEFEFHLAGASDYLARIKEAFESSVSTASPTATYLYTYADALVDFADVTAQRSKTLKAGENTAQLDTLSWTALTLADECLGQAISLANALSSATPNKARIYVLRGDVSLHRRQLALKPSAAETVRSSAAVLLKNAGVYYRGGVKLSAPEGETADVWQEASVKAWVVARKAGEGVEDQGRLEKRVENTSQILGDMVDEGLVDADFLR